MKCPHCGSTAQVRKESNYFAEEDDALIIFYTCGCGAHFRAEYKENAEGIYQYYTKYIVKIDKNLPKSKGHIHCPCNGYDCPYWEKGICSMYSVEEGWLDPMDECEDFGLFWDKGDDYIDYD